MKTTLLSLLLPLALFTNAYAEECKPPPVKHSQELERMKTLDGKWTGTTLNGKKKETVVVDYHVTAGGTAVVETLFPGSPHEMVSVYHDDDGVLTMTHYCMLGNQPRMDLTSSTPKELNFSFAEKNTINPKTEDHMHSLSLAFVDKDTIVENWSGFHQGEPGDPTAFRLTRVK